MSSITIATLPRMGRDVLAAMLSNGASSNLAIIDVRDSGKHYYFTVYPKTTS
jgi:Cdc25 family phosphatase